VVAQPFGFLGRQIQHHVPVGDVGNLVGIGEAKTICCLEDDAVEDIQLRDLQHVFDRADLLTARGSDRDALAEGLIRDPPRVALHVLHLSRRPLMGQSVARASLRGHLPGEITWNG
jgi:hypothetical protein